MLRMLREFGGVGDKLRDKVSGAAQAKLRSSFPMSG
jgi:hypothetical protein